MKTAQELFEDLNSNDENVRIEAKRASEVGKSIMETICAFANDFDNLGGGYVLVGVEENDNGMAKRPVTGINIGAVDGILKQMVGFNNMFDPYYLPRTSEKMWTGGMCW